MYIFQLNHDRRKFACYACGVSPQVVLKLLTYFKEFKKMNEIMFDYYKIQTKSKLPSLLFNVRPPSHVQKKRFDSYPKKVIYPCLKSTKVSGCLQQRSKNGLYGQMCGKKKKKKKNCLPCADVTIYIFKPDVHKNLNQGLKYF